MKQRMDPSAMRRALMAESAANSEALSAVGLFSGRNYDSLCSLLDGIRFAEIPYAGKHACVRTLERIIAHEKLEREFGLVLTEVDVAFIQTLRKTHPNLTPRECKVCFFVKLGYPTADIAWRMGVSVRGMESIRYRLHKKIGRGKHKAIKMYMMRLAGVAMQ